MGDPEQTSEEALRRELEMVREFLTQREQEIIAKMHEVEEMKALLTQRDERIRGYEKNSASVEQFLGTLDERVQREPGMLKRMRVEELLLIKPFIQPDTAHADFQDSIYILQAMEYRDREFDWARHYFFEPLRQIDGNRKLKRMLNRISDSRKPVTPGYMLYKRIAQECAKDQGLSLLQVETLLHRMVRFPSEYRNALQLMHQRNLPLSQLWPELHTEDAYRMYADALLHRLKQFSELSKEECAILQLRTRYSFDNRTNFWSALESGGIPNAERIRPLYVRINQLEQEDKPRLYPVNLRWYEHLPKDVGMFLQNYRRKPHTTS